MVGKFIERSNDFHCSKYNNKQSSAQIFYTQKSINIKSSNSLHNTFIKQDPQEGMLSSLLITRKQVAPGRNRKLS